MKAFFTPNLDRKGRLARGIGGGLLLAGAGFGFGVSIWLGLGLFAMGAFMLFEAVRGWCGLRACGLKTKL
jgi:hypothetical protein